MSMNSSIHRICSGSSGWPKPYRVAMRMKPRNATWVEMRKIRPFWTLSTMRRPSAQSVHQGRERVVAEDEVGGLLGDPGPGPHGDGDVGAMQGRRVVDAVAGDRHGPAGGPGDADQPLLLLRRRSGHDLESPELGGQAVIVPPGELVTDGDPIGVEPSLCRDRRGRQRMVPGDHDDLDPGDPCRLERFADAVAHRIGEPDQREDTCHGRSCGRCATATSRSPSVARASTRDAHAARSSGLWRDEGQDGLRRADGRLLDRSGVRAVAPRGSASATTVDRRPRGRPRGGRPGRARGRRPRTRPLERVRP